MRSSVHRHGFDDDRAIGGLCARSDVTRGCGKKKRVASPAAGQIGRVKVRATHPSQNMRNMGQPILQASRSRLAYALRFCKGWAFDAPLL